VFRDQSEAHFFKQGLQGVGDGGSELDKLETAQTHGVIKQIGHVNLQ
jgi:hypothetical protein